MQRWKRARWIRRLAGSALEVRLAIGGRVVRAVALGPGRAAFQPETGVRP